MTETPATEQVVDFLPVDIAALTAARQSMVDRRLLVTREQFRIATNLSSHAYKIIRDLGIETVGDLINDAFREFKHIPGAGKTTRSQIKAALRLFGLEQQPTMELDDWLGIAKDSHTPVTRDELHAMLANPDADWCVPPVPVKLQDDLQSLLTPAQKALLPSMPQMIEIKDDETIAVADYIRDTGGLLTDQAGEYIRNPHMLNVAVAIVALGNDAPPLVVVTSGRSTVSAVIMRKTDKNIQLFGDPSSDVSSERLLNTVDLSKGSPKEFVDHILKQTYMITANKAHLAQLGFDASAPKPPTIVLKRMPNGNEPT